VLRVSRALELHIGLRVELRVELLEELCRALVELRAELRAEPYAGVQACRLQTCRHLYGHSCG
jgi:hypothetical protein